MQWNMKYIISLAIAILMVACDNDLVDREINLPDKSEETGNIIITLPTKNQTARTNGPINSENQQSHDVLHGTVTVDKGCILIFSNAERNSSGDFTFEKKIDVDFREKTFPQGSHFNGGNNEDCTRMTATASFKPEADKYYMIYAFAYNSKGVTPEFDLGTLDNPKRVQKNDDNDMSGDVLASISIKRPDGYINDESTMEIYGGWIKECSNKPYPEAGNMPTGPVLNQTSTKIFNYGGSLSRQTGRLDITLSGVPSTVKNATLIVREYQSKIPINMEHFTNIQGLNYFRNPYTAEEKRITTIEPADGKLEFSAHMFPLDPSHIFIEIEDSEAGTKRHQIRVKDKVEDLQFIGVSVYIAIDNRITIFPNYWLLLNTQYANLVKDDNWTIEFGWGSDYNSNVPLIPSSLSLN